MSDGLAEIARQLAWSGVRAEVQVIAAKGRATASVLAAAAKDCAADLVVLGAYGHSRMHETLFGGCTRSFIRHADRAVLMIH